MRVVIDAPKVVVLGFGEFFRTLNWSTQANAKQKYQDKAVQDITLAGIFFECLGANSYRIIVLRLTLDLVFNLMQAIKHFLFLSD